MTNNLPNPDESPKDDDLDLLRQRMVRDLEEFLNQAMLRPVARLQVKPPVLSPAVRFSPSMN
jgi:hypothetical protein